MKKYKITFDVLSDAGNAVAERFGLRFKLPDYLKELYRKFGSYLERFNGDATWTLPMPARYIIDQASIIRAADVDPDYTIRPEPGRTVEKLKAMLNGCSHRADAMRKLDP